MTLSSISCGPTPAAYCNPAVFQTRATRRRDADEDDAAPAQRSEGPGRRNPLEAAMMSALQSLMPTSASTTPKATSSTAPTATAPTTAATSPAATATTATTTPDTTTTAYPVTALREAAYAFAHELYSALRGGGSGEGNNNDDGGEHQQRHHHHRSEGSSGYGDLAQRLTALAQKLDGSSPATPASTATPTAAAPAATMASPTPAVAATAPAASSGTTINITINVNLAGTAAAPATAPAAKTASSPLIDAFKHMFEALNPAGAATTTGPSPTERLSAFLRQVAQSLANGESSTQPVTPSSGSLLNVSA